MMDLFDNKQISPMLLSEEAEPFDAPGWAYELKLDGERCLAWLGTGGTQLRNKRHILMNPKVPELEEIHRQAKKRCILDGELMVMKDGAPDFREIQRRSLTSNPFKIDLAAKQFPATFCAFDILYYGGRQVTSLPLHERRALLPQAVAENERLALSRAVEGRGIALFQRAKERNLEGIVAKRLDSVYRLGARTKDWVKIKYLKDDDFVILGYRRKSGGTASLLLGQLENGLTRRVGHVTLGVSRAEFDIVAKQPVIGHEGDTVMIVPELVCTVRFMERNAHGGLRQPVFHGLRLDKNTGEATLPK